jgi:hypothetical protein
VTAPSSAPQGHARRAEAYDAPVRSDRVPTISREFLDAERRAMSPDAFATEYECQFGKAGATLFTIDRIDRMFRETA